MEVQYLRDIMLLRGNYCMASVLVPPWGRMELGGRGRKGGEREEKERKGAGRSELREGRGGREGKRNRGEIKEGVVKERRREGGMRERKREGGRWVDSEGV